MDAVRTGGVPKPGGGRFTVSISPTDGELIVGAANAESTTGGAPVEEAAPPAPRICFKNTDAS